MADSARVGYYDDQHQFSLVTIKGQDVLTPQGVSFDSHEHNTGIHLTVAQADRIANAVQEARIGAANGAASLDASGKLPVAQLPIGSGAGVVRMQYTQSGLSNVWTITHNLSEKYVSVQALDDTDSVLVPNIVFSSDNVVVLTFASPVQGTAIIRK